MKSIWFYLKNKSRLWQKKTKKGEKIMEMHPKNDVNSCEQATKLPQLKKHTNFSQFDLSHFIKIFKDLKN